MAFLLILLLGGGLALDRCHVCLLTNSLHEQNQFDSDLIAEISRYARCPTKPHTRYGLLINVSLTLEYVNIKHMPVVAFRLNHFPSPTQLSNPLVVFGDAFSIH